MKRIIFVLAIIAITGALLYPVFRGYWILPQFFSLGPLQIRYYGIVLALAVAAAFYLATKRAQTYQVSPASAEDLIFWVVLGGFVGARLYHAFSSFSFYIRHPISILEVWKGGLSIYGAILGGFIALVGVKIIFKLKSSILNLLDWLAPCVLLGQIIGRLGNLFNYEAFGYPANLPWQMFVPAEFRPPGFEAAQYFQPLFLYEVLGNILILIFLLWYFKNSKSSRGLVSASQTPSGSISLDKAAAGKLFFMYLLLYNILRFFLEFLRIDSTFVHGIRLNSITSLAFVIISLVYLGLTRHAQEP